MVVKTNAEEKAVIFLCSSDEPTAGGQVQQRLYLPHILDSQALSNSGEKLTAAVGITACSNALPATACSKFFFTLFRKFLVEFLSQRAGIFRRWRGGFDNKPLSAKSFHDLCGIFRQIHAGIFGVIPVALTQAQHRFSRGGVPHRFPVVYLRNGKVQPFKPIYLHHRRGYMMNIPAGVNHNAAEFP